MRHRTPAVRASLGIHLEDSKVHAQLDLFLSIPPLKPPGNHLSGGIQPGQ